MKIGLIKIGERLSYNIKSDAGMASGEPLVVAKLLSEMGNEVKLGTVIKRNDLLSRPDINNDLVSLVDIEESIDPILSCDALVVWCGYIDFWGGAEAPYIMNQYEIINKFKGKILYILTDIVVPPVQLWPKIEGRPWGPKYKKEDIWIERQDITIASQAHNKEFLEKLLKAYPHKEVINLPLWKLPALYNNPKRFNQDPEFDLIYGGLNNRKKRYPKILKWFFESGAKTGLFGRDLLADKEFVKKLPEKFDAEYLAKVKFGQQVVNFTNFAAKATVVIGDPDYEESQLIPNRFVEGILSSIVCFIDIDLDPDKKLIRNKELSDFLYVESVDQLNESLKLLKDNDYRKRIVDLQFEELGNTEDLKNEVYGELIKLLK